MGELGVNFRFVIFSESRGRLYVPAITDIAEALFTAFETGKGWKGCSTYCRPNATFPHRRSRSWMSRRLSSTSIG